MEWIENCFFVSHTKGIAMKNVRLFFITYFIYILPTFSQAAVIEWTKTFIGVKNEYVNSVYQTVYGG